MNTTQLLQQSIEQEHYLNALTDLIQPPIIITNECIKGVEIPYVAFPMSDTQHLQTLSDLLKLQIIREGDLGLYVQQYKPLLDDIKQYKNDLDYWDLVDELIEIIPELEPYFNDELKSK